MSANSRITIRCGGVYFTFSRWLNSFLIGFVADSFRDMLADSEKFFPRTGIRSGTRIGIRPCLDEKQAERLCELQEEFVW